MAVVARNSVESLIRKTLDRQAAIAQVQFKIKEKQVENSLVNYVEKGDAGPFLQLLRDLTKFTLTDKNFSFLMRDCLINIMLMKTDLNNFLDVIFNIDWISRNEELVQLYSSFILSLVTAHSYHCPRVMTSLVKLFKVEQENWEDSPSEETLSKWSNVHMVIRQIILIMPMASDILMKTIVHHFQYFPSNCNVHRSYMYNLIWITKYLPSLTEEIMSAAVNKMVELDVSMSESTKNKINDEPIFNMELECKNDVGTILDYYMFEMLQWLNNEKDSLIDIMCRVFETVVLPTYGIKRVPFLILYTISLNHKCADRVLKSLWCIAAGLQNFTLGAVAIRNTAVTHLAGLLARCSRIPESWLIHYLAVMSEWCHSYITATRDSSAFSNHSNVHGVFHAICHSIFYLIAFKHKQLFFSKEGLHFLESLNLPRIITSNLNPLATCPPQVQQAFSSVTRQHQLVYCSTIIERNVRQSIKQQDAHLTYWFPYDPYTLPKSGKLISPLYVDYKDWGNGQEMKDLVSGSVEMEVDEDDFLMSVSPTKKSGSLSNCISTGFVGYESLMS